MADRTPNTRLEKWMAKIAGETVDITPKDRLETLLAKIAGESVSITPDDTFEYWLNQIAENASGGGGGKMGSFTFTNGVKLSGDDGVAPWSLEQVSGAINLVKKPAKENESVQVNVPLFDGFAPEMLVLVSNLTASTTQTLMVECTNCDGRVVQHGVMNTILALTATRENLEAGNASVRMYYG